MPDKIGLVSDTTSNSSCYYFPVKKSKYFLVILIGFVLFMLYRPPKVFYSPDMVLQDFIYQNKTINILFWTKYFGHYDWYAEDDGNAGIKTLESENCPVTNCFFTHNHSFFKNKVDFDAILIHGPEYLHQIPPHFSPKQMYIFVSLE
jgi:hypothetical protein